ARMSIVDGDGHVMEGPRGEYLVEYLDEPYRSASLMGGVFPPLDHLHSEPIEYPPGAANQMVGVAEWSSFLSDVGIEASVLYPTYGLAVGVITNRDWAVALTRAYNDWLHASHLRVNPALHGMALLPLQDPGAAVDELRRAVEELGMRGAMLPANG